MLAVQADGASVRDGRGPRPGRRADAAPAGLPRAPRAPVRLLHARDADGGDGAAREEPAPDRRRDPQGPPGQHLPLHRLLEHHQGGQGRLRPGGRRNERDHRRARATSRSRLRPSRSAGPGQSVPRKEDRRLVQGQGVFVDDIKRHNMGFAHYVRSPYAHAVIKSVDVSAALARARRLRHAHRRRGRDADRPVLPALDAARERDQGLRARRRPRPLRRRPGRDRRRRDPRARPRRRRARRGRLRAAARDHRRAPRARRGRAGAPSRRRHRTSSGRASTSGAAGTTRSRRPTGS